MFEFNSGDWLIQISWSWKIRSKPIESFWFNFCLFSNVHSNVILIGDIKSESGINILHYKTIYYKLIDLQWMLIWHIYACKDFFFICLDYPIHSKVNNAFKQI